MIYELLTHRASYICAWAKGTKAGVRKSKRLTILPISKVRSYFSVLFFPLCSNLFPYSQIHRLFQMDHGARSLSLMVLFHARNIIHLCLCSSHSHVLIQQALPNLKFPFPEIIPYQQLCWATSTWMYVYVNTDAISIKLSMIQTYL